jgi:hypothetical protein
LQIYNTSPEKSIVYDSDKWQYCQSINTNQDKVSVIFHNLCDNGLKMSILSDGIEFELKE